MRWFKHFADARRNPKLRLIEKKLSEAGYARAFKLLEVIAERGGSGEAFKPRLDLRKPHTGMAWLADELGISEAALGRTLRVFAEARFINQRMLRKQVIYVPAMREYVDEWARKRRSPEKPCRQFGATPERQHELLRSGSRGTPAPLAAESKSEVDIENREEDHLPPKQSHNYLLDDRSFRRLEDQLVSDFPTTPTRQLAWALRLVMVRVTTPPTNPVAYYRKSLRGVFENLTAETQGWLKNEAYRRLRESSELRLPDLAESLKCLAAENSLDCGLHGEFVHEAIDGALRRLEEERRTQSEICVGRSPELCDERRR